MMGEFLYSYIVCIRVSAPPPPSSKTPPHPSLSCTQAPLLKSINFPSPPCLGNPLLGFSCHPPKSWIFQLSVSPKTIKVFHP